MDILSSQIKSVEGQGSGGTMTQSTPHILIVNQHGENRGDEAAMRAMVHAFVKHLGEATKFTMVYQFRSRNLKPELNEKVNCFPMVMPAYKAFGLLIYILGKMVGISLPFLLDATTEQIARAYEATDVVVSAPGGPYLGDIYYKHELVHWFFIWIAKVYKKPVVLYATSVGPFRIRILNMLRRRLFRRFNVVCVREKISRDYIQKLCGESVRVYVTADSALQQCFPAFEKQEYFQGEKASLVDKFLVSVSAIQYSYPGMSHVPELQAHYENSILECLSHLGKRKDCHFLFFPQLYGEVHSDVPFLKKIGAKLPTDFSWEIVDKELNSDSQQRLFAMSDVCIASRYHPQIFAASAGVPGVCIYYEHKAFGFMEMMGMKEFAFDIRGLKSGDICRKLDEAVERRDELSAIIKERIIPLRETARRTTLLSVDLLKRTHG